MENEHKSVMPKEVMDALDVHPHDVVLDATIGGAGHFSVLLEKLGADGTIIGIDADPAAVERARTEYARDRRPEKPVAHLVTDNYRNLERILERLGVGAVDKALFDLGWSGYQLSAGKGFSFQTNEPLVMTYGEGGETAADIVNSYSEKELADLIYAHGEERFARGIARAIVSARAKAHILTTEALVAAVIAGTPTWYQKRKSHPATKTFQALRIAVNDELNAVREGVASALRALSPGGKLAVITFHSLEDRVVKNLFREAEKTEMGALSPKKPAVPGRKEIIENRRARSAKLRVFEKARAESGPVNSGMSLYCYA